MPTFTNNTVGDEHAIVGVAEKGIGVFGRSQTNNTGVGGMSDSGIGVHGVSETADGVFGVSEMAAVYLAEAMSPQASKASAKAAARAFSEAV